MIKRISFLLFEFQHPNSPSNFTLTVAVNSKSNYFYLQNKPQHNLLRYQHKLLTFPPLHSEVHFSWVPVTLAIRNTRCVRNIRPNLCFSKNSEAPSRSYSVMSVFFFFFSNSTLSISSLCQLLLKCFPCAVKTFFSKAYTISHKLLITLKINRAYDTFYDLAYPLAQ